MLLGEVRKAELERDRRIRGGFRARLLEEGHGLGGLSLRRVDDARVVERLDVLRVDGERLLEALEGLGVLLLVDLDDRLGDIHVGLGRLGEDRPDRTERERHDEDHHGEAGTHHRESFITDCFRQGKRLRHLSRVPLPSCSAARRPSRPPSMNQRCHRSSSAAGTPLSRATVSTA